MSKRAEVLPTDKPILFETAVGRAVELLRAGELVALPTETVYGLAANALDAQAVAKIFAVKNRPANNPVIVHVEGIEMAGRCVAAWPSVAGKLARAFWPGPLTLVLPRAKDIPDIVTAGGDTVGVRWPSHPFIQAVIRECGFPLAAPSANPSSQVSPTNAQHVLKSLGAQIRLIIDGGQSQVGIESTVMDLTVIPPHVLRPGIIHAESLVAVTGELQRSVGESPAAEALRSPGLLPRHYAPKSKMVILRWCDDDELRAQLAPFNLDPPTIHVIAHTRVPGQIVGRVSVIPHDPEAFARAIYAELHQCEETGARLIVVEALPDTAPWQAINDRLRRATI